MGTQQLLVGHDRAPQCDLTTLADLGAGRSSGQGRRRGGTALPLPHKQRGAWALALGFWLAPSLPDMPAAVALGLCRGRWVRGRAGE